MNKKLVLASQSPRRRELISLLGVPFAVVGPMCDEIYHPELSIDKQIESIAHDKARSVLADHEDNIVIGSDTVVVCDGEILGKPQDENDAKRMLRQLSGKTHAVITGVAILSSNHEEVYSVNTLVTFNEMSDDEIDSYIASREPMDKAGAYAIQGKGSLFIRNIEGDYYSVMGLPVSSIYKRLNENQW